MGGPEGAKVRLEQDNVCITRHIMGAD